MILGLLVLFSLPNQIVLFAFGLSLASDLAVLALVIILGVIVLLISLLNEVGLLHLDLARRKRPRVFIFIIVSGEDGQTGLIVKAAKR